MIGVLIPLVPYSVWENENMVAMVVLALLFIALLKSLCVVEYVGKWLGVVMAILSTCGSVYRSFNFWISRK